jgi:hypothetical protein
MPDKNPQTGQENWSEAEIEAAIAQIDKTYRLDPPFPYVVIPFDEGAMGVNAQGVDIPFSDTQ